MGEAIRTGVPIALAGGGAALDFDRLAIRGRMPVSGAGLAGVLVAVGLTVAEATAARAADPLDGDSTKTSASALKGE